MPHRFLRSVVFLLTLSSLWLSAFGQAIGPMVGIDLPVSLVGTKISAQPAGSSGPVELVFRNDDSAQFTLEFTLADDLTYAQPQDSSAPLIRLVGLGYTLTSNTQPGPWVNGGILNINNPAALTYSNAVGVEGAAAIAAISQGSDGYANNDRNPIPATFNGNDSGTVSVQHSGAISVIGSDGPNISGILAVARGGDGAEGQSNDTPYAGPGGRGGDISIATASGSTIQISSSGPIAQSSGIFALSQGGLPASNSGPGGFVGASNPGGAVSVQHQGAIVNSTAAGIGINARSVGGAGGTVSFQDGPENTYYGESAPGGAVTVTVGGSIAITGPSGIGIFAASTAGASSADAHSEYEATGEEVTITLGPSARITTGGNGGSAFGIGVLGVSAGTSTVLDPFNAQTVATSGSGYAGDVTLVNEGTVITVGEMAIGLAALGVGGAGVVATADGSGLSYLGNSSYVNQAGGSTIAVTNLGTVTTLGSSAHGMVAISTAGGGLIRNAAATGNDGESWIFGSIIGANSSATSGSLDAIYNGGSVNLVNAGTLTTGNGQGGGDASIGIVAQSIGGGGGTAGGSHPSAFVGDAGGNGGNGGAVTVDLQSGTTLTTHDLGSVGMLAQSIGGGGGNGANAAGVFVAVGGQGGGGGHGGTVQATLDAGSIQTFGNFSGALVAHSIGGGGGHGGYADSVGLLIDAAIGGHGGGGGDGGAVTAGNTLGTLTTQGNHSPGMVAQSIGGGGGIGGAANSYDVGVAFSVAIALGGSGGDGGDGGSVGVSNTGSITTGISNTTGLSGPFAAGADSHAILAQSIGGGGGYGGAATADSLTFSTAEIPVAASFSVAHGGRGGGGGGAGQVSVANAGWLTTHGDGSHAVIAHSIGGGGGNGGDATATSYLIEGGPPSLKIAIGLGGNSGGGGDGQSVTVNQGATNGPSGIVTHGQFAAGILAQSIGGGGGNAGAGNSSDSSPNLGADTGTSIDVAFALGGQGGGGGSGEAVAVTQGADSAIQTAGSASPGIQAQSIGGGGGTGGGGSAAASGDSYQVNLSVGGGGGTAGAGGGITVTNAGIIATRGGNSHGIIAQSIGGGGGSAGSSDAAATISTAGQIEDALNQPSDSYSANIAVGLSGGGGGDGGTVSINNAAGSVAPDGTWIPGISTDGIRAYGVVAQSIAGGGGTGGAATSSSNSVLGGPSNGKSGTYSVDLAIGSMGGSSGTGGTVEVTNDGVIITRGFSSHALVLQSIGGGGGVGGEGTVDSSATIGLGADSQGIIGENGGGGMISATHSGAILTIGADSSGILAQSIGGGGGLASTGDPTFNTSTPAAAPGVNFTLGANAGGGGTAAGGTVSLDLSGTILTRGDWSHGVLAQSVGGGGGMASSVFSDATAPEISMTVGADGGLGNGGAIHLNLTNATVRTGVVISNAPTAGYSAFGIFAQSIGGGGGTGHDGSLNGENGNAAASGIPGIQTGLHGDGNGGAISLTGSGTITTAGDAAHAVVLQSIGGSGGHAAQGNSRFEGSSSAAENPIRVSAGGINSVGEGGSISATLTAQIETRGDNAFGFLAQSIGGGGGLSVAQNASRLDAYVGNGAADVANSGGTVQLTFNGGSTLSTSGAGAHGIVVQSIGGGGGIANYSTSGATLSTEPPGSYQASGDGADVTVRLDADVLTTGSFAHGLVAQSLGAGGGLLALGDTWYAGSTGSGSGSGSSVTITQQGSLTASGHNSIGIFAQSSGSEGSLSLSVEGAVRGGSGSGGAGIWADGGSSATDGSGNQVTLQPGSSVGALSGQAIRYTGAGLLNVVNNGTLNGSVQLAGAAGTGTLINGGTINAGAVLTANVQNDATLLVNALPKGATASLEAGVRPHSAPAPSVRVRGGFGQSAAGIIVVAADFSSGTGGFLRIEGDARLSGKIQAAPSSVLPRVEIPVLQVDGRILPSEDGPLTAADSALFDYELTQAGNQFRLRANSADFAPGDFALERDERAVAGHLQRIWDLDSYPQFGPFFATLDSAATDSTEAYAAQLRQLSPGNALGFASRRVADLLGFAGSVVGTQRYAEGRGQFEETTGIWSRSYGSSARQSSDDGLPKFTLNNSVTQIGGQTEFSPDWFLGGAVAYEYDWLRSADQLTSGHGQGGLGALTLKRQHLDWYFTAAAFGSFGFYDTTRRITIPGYEAEASGSPDLQSAGFLLRAAYLKSFDALYLRPSLSLSTIYVHAGRFTESGGGPLALTVESGEQTTVIGTVGLEIGRPYELPGGQILRPYLTGSVGFLSQDSWEQVARFDGVSDPIGGFSTVVPMDPIVGRVVCGLQLEASDHLSFNLQFQGEYSEHLVSNGGSIGVAWDF